MTLHIYPRSANASFQIPGKQYGMVDFNLRDRSLNANDDLHIDGRSSGSARGRYNELQEAHIDTEVVGGKEENIITWEHALVHSQAGRPFSEPGDSGAFVRTRGGEFVGLLFGVAPSKNVSYFTHVRDLYADIQEHTGAVAVRILPED